MKLPGKQTMYKALVNKDSSFEGIFFAGITTTKIFCRPTCGARKPKAENVEYFASSKNALSHGYRPCKVCMPLKPYGEDPEWLKELLSKIDQQTLKLTDYEIKELGIDPNRVRRWFKKHHNMTFQEFLRLRRLGGALSDIKQGKSVTQSAFDSGFESLSGFGYSYKQSLDHNPRDGKDMNIVIVKRIVTPLGPMLAGVIDNELCLLEFVDRRMLETQLKRISKIFKANVIPGNHLLFDNVQSQLNEYFDGSRKTFNIPLNISGTDFQESVWQVLQTIPYGKTRSYAQQAVAINNPKAVRAVANANGDNRIAIIIPCHRVIGSNGTLTGYGGGLYRKRFLLELEQKNG